jgi:hypothetical protein
MRLKYPFLVDVALAASAPIYLDSVGLTSPTAYYDVVEDTTAKISPKCPAAVKAGDVTPAVCHPTCFHFACTLYAPTPTAQTAAACVRAHRFAKR